MHRKNRKFKVGASVVVDTKQVRSFGLPKSVHGLKERKVYSVEQVRCVPRTSGHPQDYAREAVGCGQFVRVNGEQFSAAWFRPATSAEVKRCAK